MKKMILVLCCSCMLLSSFAQQTITIQFRNTIGNEVLQLGASYKNAFGENMVINRFKYYVSNFRLVDVNGKSVSVTNNYYLIDEADTTSKTIVVTTSVKQFVAVEFLLGIDSIKNISGVQTGALDPMNGMFWTWNSGYIIAKLEGVSPFAKVPGNLFSYHVGGFKTGENATRLIRLELSNFKFQTSNSIVIEADINKWFQSAHDIKIEAHPICHSPGTFALQMADNYAIMFKIVTVN